MTDGHKRPNATLKVAVILLFAAVIFSGVTRLEGASLFSEMGIYGGQINSVAVDPNDPLIAYAGSYGGDGLFKTLDNGTTWTTVAGFRNSIVYDIAISAGGSNIWVAHSDKVSMSRDSGNSWKQVYPGLSDNESRTCYCVAIDPNDWLGNTVYIGTGGPNGSDLAGSIFMTMNHGLTWTKKTFPEAYNIWDISFNSGNPGEVWAASRESVVSKNGMIFMRPGYLGGWYSWNEAVFGNLRTNMGYIDEIVSQSGDEKVFASGGYGILGVQNGPDVDGTYFSAVSPEPCRALAIDPESNDIVYAGLEDTVVKSTDSGSTFDDVYDVTGSGPFLSMSVSGSDPDIIFGGTYNRGVFVSKDGAETWARANSGLLATAIYDTDISSQNSGKIVAASLSGVYFKDGEDAEWERIEDDSAYAVAFHPVNDDVIYAGFKRKIGKTTNGGSTWTYRDVSSSADAHHVSAIDISGLAPNRILAGIAFTDEAGGGEIVKITDSAEDISSADISSVFTSTVPVNSVVSSPEDPSFVFAGTGRFFAPADGPGNLYASTDSGDTWTVSELQDVVVNNIAVSGSDPDIVYAACGDTDLKYAGIYRSLNGGISWLKVTGGLPENLAVSDVRIDENNSDFIYAALYRGYNSCSDPVCSYFNGIYTSTNGGENWSQSGLSDYYLYDVNSYGKGGTVRLSSSGLNRSFSYPEATVVAGTGSGAYSSSTSTGRGIIFGFARDYDTREPVTDGTVSSDLGSKCMTDENGFYSLFAASGTHRISLWSPSHLSSSHLNVIVTTGGSVDLGTDYLKPGSSGTADSTCFLEDLLGLSASKELLSFRAFRDEVLSHSPPGRSLIDIYYRSGKELLKVIHRDPELKNRCLKIIFKLFPLINRGNPAFPEIPEVLMSEIRDFMYRLRKVSSPSLKKELEETEINLGKIYTN